LLFSNLNLSISCITFSILRTFERKKKMRKKISLFFSNYIKGKNGLDDETNLESSIVRVLVVIWRI